MEVEVAVPTPVAGTFTYKFDRSLEPGTRVVVPFGGRRVVGVALACSPDATEKRKYALKSIEESLDLEPVYSPIILKIARWLSSYYIFPLGEVLRTMLPASKQISQKKTVLLTESGCAAVLAAETTVGKLLLEVYAKRKSLTFRTFGQKLTAVQSKCFDDEQVSMKDLIKLGLIVLEKGEAIKARAGSSDEAVKVSFGDEDLQEIQKLGFQLGGEQQAAYNYIREHGIEAEAPEQPFVLKGVTGSGKTEIYLQLISAALASCLEKGESVAQSLVLVPEISLTPQMTDIFEKRFSGRVAVVHSAMSDTERWRELNRIRTGEALILIGPRSAVFGPFNNLKLIIVDEEHDSSYKQNTGLMYNGRDVAILRGKLETASVVLGSATPSIESYQNALAGKFKLLELKNRVGNRPLPEVELIASKPAFSQGQVLSAQTARSGLQRFDVPIDEQIIADLEANFARKMQSIVIVNRRGFAYYLFSLNKKKAVSCPQCSISLTLHRSSQVLRCHYCDFSKSTYTILQESPDDQFLAVGYGSEKVESFLRQKIPEANIVRLDSDTVAKKDALTTTLTDFRNGKIDILVGTQILAKGHDFPNVTLMAILEVDQLLELPDFRAGERTFQLIVQAAGRAGRAENAGKVLVQCSRASHPVIQAALTQDYETFATREVELREQCQYPPFRKMIVAEFNSTDLNRLNQLCQRVEKWFEEMAKINPEIAEFVRVLGPTTPAIETVRNRHRRTLLFSSANNEALWFLVGQFSKAFQKLGGDIRMKIDVDPQSLI